MSYLKNAAKELATPPQSEPLNERQVKNSAGGYSFPVDCWKRMDRFLVLGSEGGSYYASEKKLTKDNLGAVQECLKEDGLRAVKRIVEISDSGRAPKNDPALMALAMAAADSSDAVRSSALDALPQVARIGTHLFHFVDYVVQFRGWGRGLTRAISFWYDEKHADKFADQVTKYQQRDGWSHRDLMRLSHPKFTGAAQKAIARWVVKSEITEALPSRIKAHLELQKCSDVLKACSLIRQFGLVRESVPTELLNNAAVWEALLEKMPMTAMIRNLGKMSSVGLLKPLSNASKLVVAKLTDVESLTKSRVHPIQILMAAKTYQSGRGVRGSNSWTVVQQVVDALDEAYYASFKNVEPTNKRFYLGLDISGSMWLGQVAGISDFAPAVASAAMAMVTVKSEKDYYCAGFTDGMRNRRYISEGTVMTPVSLSPKLRLESVLTETRRLSQHMGGTDCALPMLDALEKKLEVDTFIIYTDSETWHGSIHPMQALEQYRQKTGLAAKLIVCGMVSNGFSIADPNDAGSLDVVGFDSATPQIIADFSRE